MINEARTLIRNRPAALATGSQYVDPQFAPVAYSSGVNELRRALFPEDIDEVSLNLLLDIYMRIFHQEDLRRFDRLFDPRITYNVRSNFWFEFASSLPRVTYSYGDMATYANTQIVVDRVAVSDQFQPPIERSYVVEYDSPSTVKVGRNNQFVTSPIVLDSTGTSNWIWIEEPWLRFRLWTSQGGLVSSFRFVVDDMNHFKLDLLSVLQRVKQAGDVSFNVWLNELGYTDIYAFYRYASSTNEQLGIRLLLLALKMKNEHGAI